MTRTNPAPERPQHDEGISLVEVLVALLVFAILATGIVAGMTTIARMTADNRARVTAANLAAQDMDLVRAIGDPVGITGSTTTVPVDGRTYTVVRSASWVSQAGADLTCGSSTKRMFMRVNVRVTWPEKLGSTPAVQDDTILAPKGSANDTATGSIAIEVDGSDGGPEQGVGVTVTPVTGGAALTKQPDPTNANGCTYANGVVPGTYDVTISKNGWIDADQQATTATERVVVTAGTTQAPSFALYDQAASVKTTLAYRSGAYGLVVAPVNLETTWVNTSGVWTTPTTPATVTRFPYSGGYGVVAGLTQSGSKSCASVDPQAWPAATVNGVALAAGVRPTTGDTLPGQSSTVGVGVGVIQVKAPLGATIGFTQATPAPGTPSCGITGSVYYYSKTASGDFQAFAVPFGSWKVYYGGDFYATTQVTAANLKVKTNVATTGVAPDGTITIDPRDAK